MPTRRLRTIQYTPVQHGFTIVELLIVIVIIGILAAITIVAYNGIQDRARLVAGLSFESQLRQKYGLTVKGTWSFDECSGSTVSNTGEPANSDAITGTATWITDTPSGRGCALRFNGTTRIETQATLGSTSYVKAAWVRITTGPCNNIISQAAVGGASAAFYMPSCKPSAGHNGAWSTAQSSRTINDGKWHYLAAIWENGGLTIYVDGEVTGSASGVVAPSPLGFVSIASHAGGNYTTGDIDNPFVASE